MLSLRGAARKGGDVAIPCGDADAPDVGNIAQIRASVAFPATGSPGNLEGIVPKGISFGHHTSVRYFTAMTCVLFGASKTSNYNFALSLERIRSVSRSTSEGSTETAFFS